MEQEIIKDNNYISQLIDNCYKNNIAHDELPIEFQIGMDYFLGSLESTLKSHCKKVSIAYSKWLDLNDYEVDGSDEANSKLFDTFLNELNQGK